MTRVLKSADFWSGMALAALGAWIIFQARQWEYLGVDGPGAGFFPLWYGIAFVALALALAGSSLARTVAEQVRIDRAAVRRALGAWAALALAIASFAVIGFVLGFGLLCFFMAAVLYRRSLWPAALVAVLASVGFYLVFALALGVALPTGWFGF